LLPWGNAAFEPLVQEFPERRSAGVYFSDEKEEKMVVEKNSY
jgi:hypothetical protein